MVDCKYSSSLFFKRVFSLNLSPNENQLIATTMEPVAADPEFMQKMSTLKWSKDEQYIKTPEYEKRRSALFDSHFGRPASLAGAKPRKKKTSTASDEEETSSGNSSASDGEKASSAASKKRSSMSKDAKLAEASRKKKKRFGKKSSVTSQMEEYCVTALWVRNADFTGKAVKLIIPYKYDRLLVTVLVALLSLVCTGTRTRMVRRRSNGCKVRTGFGIAHCARKRRARVPRSTLSTIRGSPPKCYTTLIVSTSTR
jgi:hypothetical protein